MQRSSVGLAALLASLSMLLAACIDPSVEGTAVNTTEPRWVAQHDPSTKVAVVFIHGIFGDTIGTWANTEANTNFFDLLSADPSVGNKIDLFAFGYTSNMLSNSGSSFSVQEAANRLNDRLKFHGVLDYPSIVFVAHSMGGLVTLRHLLTYRELIDKVPLIAFYATPQEGAQIAAVARLASANPALQDMLPADYNNFLQVLNDDWKEATRTRGPVIVCGYEKRPTAGIDVVLWSSATRFCTGAPRAIDADHISIVKPNGPQHDSIVLLVNALNEFVVGEAALPRLELQDFVQDGDRWIYTLNTAIARQPARLRNAGRLPLNYEIVDVSDSSLHIWPADTPRTLNGGQRDDMTFALGYGAQTSEYLFTLRSSAHGDQPVTVRVPDLAGLLAEQTALTVRMTEDVNVWLSTESVSAELSAMQPGDPVVTQRVLERARQTVDREMPDAPESLRWLITAEMLRSANWSTLAVEALRNAEKSSPPIVRASSVQRSAALVAAAAGESRVFTAIENPTLTGPLPATQSLLQAGLQPAVASELARRLRSVPDLRATGLALEGDLQRFRGDNEAARRSYENAALLQPTPDLSNRIRTLPSRVAEPGAAIRGSQLDRAAEISQPGVTVPQTIDRANQLAEREQ